MIFVIIAKDGTDADAPTRRQAVRAAHLSHGDHLKAEGKLHYGVALCDDQDKMIGSIYVIDFPNRATVDDYLKTEPYVTGGVWQDIQIHVGKIGPAFLR